MKNQSPQEPQNDSNTLGWILAVVALLIIAAVAFVASAFATEDVDAAAPYVVNEQEQQLEDTGNGEEASSPTDEEVAIADEALLAEENTPESGLGLEALSADENVVNPLQLPDSSFIYDTSIADLSDAGPYYDGQIVQVTGEVVGDNIRADLGGDYRWILLTSLTSSETITVYMSAVQAEKIDTFGQYGSTGTVLQVRGTFNLICDEHEGLSDLHAETVTVVQAGKTHVEEFDPHAFVPGVVSVTFGGILFLVYRKVRKRRR